MTFVAMVGSNLLYVFLGAVPVRALDPKKHVTQYLHTAWRIQDGSLPKGMYSITQTADGFLWFSASAPEVYRFDGVRFDSQTISVNGKTISPVIKLFGDRSGGLWAVGPQDLVRLKSGTPISHYDFDILSDRDLSEDPDGSLWLLRPPGTAMNGPLCHVSDRGVQCFGKAEGQPIPVAASFLRDADGGFWIGGLKALAHWHDGVSEVYPIEALKNITGGTPLMALARAPDGSLWAGAMETPPGLARVTEGSLKSFVTPNFDGRKIPVKTMIVDRDGNLWVGSLGQGIFRIRGDVVEHYGRSEGLSSDNVNAIFEDREGILWIATPSGIDRFRNPPITSFSSLEGLGMDLALGVLAGRDGTIWVANGNSLDHIAGEKITSIRQGHGLPGEQPTSMLEDSAGNFWVGVDDDLYLLKNGHFQRFSGPHHESLGMVFGLAQDGEGNIWVLCNSKLVRIRDFRVQEELVVPPFSQLRRIAADRHDGIWMVTAAGDLLLLRKGTVQKYSLNISGLSIEQMVTLADGSVLVTTSGGLVGLQRGEVQRMSSKNGLPCDSVISAVEDEDKRWWLSTDCGVVEFPNSELERWWANPEAMIQLRVFDALDGARTGDRPPFDNSTALSRDGRIWFATGTVVQVVDPATLSQKALPAETYIESVIVDRREVQLGDNLKLPPRPRDIQIDYTSPTFTVPQRVKFRYRLDPYDRDWHDAGTRRQAFYTDLPPGKYSFRVTASNGEDVWDDSPANLDFFVVPAYYQTNWFRALCAAAFFALLWTAYQWRIQQLQHQFDMTLDARVAERTRIARELHDTLLQSAHGLLLRIHIVSKLLPDSPMEAKERLDQAIDQTAEFITEARDEVQGLRDSTVQGNDLAMAINTLGEELKIHSANRTPAFRVSVEGESRELHPIVRDEIYRIAAEALRNAFRHSEARCVEVEIRYGGEEFRLRVRDDGKGIDPAILERQGQEGHYGLPGMRERATLAGGELGVWSELDAGTEVELRIRARTVYATGRNSSWWARMFVAKG